MTKEFSLTSRDFLSMCIANFLYFGSFYMLIPTLPQYVAQLGGSPGITTGSIVLGLVADGWGYATMFIVGGLIVIGGLVLFALGIRTNTLPERSES